MELNNITTPAVAILKCLALKIAPSLAIGALTALASTTVLSKAFDYIPAGNIIKPDKTSNLYAPYSIGLVCGLFASIGTFNRL